MKHLDLFSGIGGFALAAHWMGWETVQFVEIDKFCQKVLAKNFPNIPIHGDIKTFNSDESVDILTGGFPCQPFSYAGRRKQKTDERHLWPEMFRVARRTKPKVIVGENVSGIFGLVDEICANLESEGYKVEPIGIEASCIGSDNLRERYWFIAYSSSLGWEHLLYDNGAYRKKIEYSEWREANELDSLGNPFLQFEERYGEPAIFGEYDGLPKRLDVSKRLKSIGNSIDPRVVYQIFRVIEMMDTISSKQNPSLYPNETNEIPDF